MSRQDRDAAEKHLAAAADFERLVGGEYVSDETSVAYAGLAQAHAALALVHTLRDEGERLRRVLDDIARSSS